MTIAGIDLNFGSLMAFTTAFGTITASAASLTGAWQELYLSYPSFDRLAPLIKAAPEVDDDKEFPFELSGQIHVDHVSFRYSDHAPLVLDDLSMDVKAGEYLGIVGASGCGKSTLLKLLLGFEEPLEGAIYYDQANLSDLNKRELRKKIGVVLQNDTTVSGSIIDNIRLTAPEAGYNKVMEAVRKVGLEEDIKKMPLGIRTMLGERGGSISGGQRQRITIARALIHEPSILFLDEATSALDNLTQKKIIETLDHLKATRLVVAHRLSTVIHCDRILVLDKGKIVEEGDYRQLMEKKGLFYALASRQLT